MGNFVLVPYCLELIKLVGACQLAAISSNRCLTDSREINQVGGQGFTIEGAAMTSISTGLLLNDLRVFEINVSASTVGLRCGRLVSSGRFFLCLGLMSGRDPII